MVLGKPVLSTLLSRRVLPNGNSRVFNNFLNQARLPIRHMS